MDGDTLILTPVRSVPFVVCGEAVILVAASTTAVPLRLCSPAKN
jgi:hypothetical protein